MFRFFINNYKYFSWSYVSWTESEGYYETNLQNEVKIRVLKNNSDNTYKLVFVIPDVDNIVLTEDEITTPNKVYNLAVIYDNIASLIKEQEEEYTFRYVYEVMDKVVTQLTFNR